MTYSVAKIQRDLQLLGVRNGEVLMVHASLRAIGPVVGGADGVIDALDVAVGPTGAVMMVLGAHNEFDWVNARAEKERGRLLLGSPPFDALLTPADKDVGYLAEVFRQRDGTRVTDNPEGRFGARGARSAQLLVDAPWHDYFGPGSPLEKLIQANGKILRMGADPDTTTLLHYGEYLAPILNKRQVCRHRLVQGSGETEVRKIMCLDDTNGIVDVVGEDYFKTILEAFLSSEAALTGQIGEAESQLIDANDLLKFGVNWMGENLNS